MKKQAYDVRVGDQVEMEQGSARVVTGTTLVPAVLLEFVGGGTVLVPRWQEIEVGD